MKVEIWSDVTCTHCYTAKRKFEHALSQFTSNDKIQVIWKSFELAPGLKTDPKKYLPQFLQELQGIKLEQAQAMIDQVTNSVKEMGLEYNLNKAIPANSYNAHRLSHFAKDKGVQNKMEERIFKAYFNEGKNIDDIPTLITIGKEIGLNPFEVRTILETTEYADDVNQDLSEAKQIGITSVPTYVFNSNTIVTGTQDSNMYLEILKQEFAQWENDQVMRATKNIDGQSCKIGDGCK
jgi:predicted DsbA family dithiol-disulfide isomerase